MLIELSHHRSDQIKVTGWHKQNMSDTTLKNCKICEKEFDSITQVDNGICDECLELDAESEMHRRMTSEPVPERVEDIKF